MTANEIPSIGQDCESAAPVLTEAERHKLLVEWNRTERDYPRDKCVHQLFEEQVERSPEAVAVVFEGQTLTYRELNKRSNRLAHHLRRMGVETGDLVGLCLERSNIRSQGSSGAIDFLSHAGYSAPLSGCSVAW